MKKESSLLQPTLIIIPWIAACIKTCKILNVKKSPFWTEIQVCDFKRKLCGRKYQSVNFGRFPKQLISLVVILQNIHKQRCRSLTFQTVQFSMFYSELFMGVGFFKSGIRNSTFELIKIMRLKHLSQQTKVGILNTN